MISPVFRDVMQPFRSEQDNYKRKSSAKINESNKKLKDKMIDQQQGSQNDKEPKQQNEELQGNLKNVIKNKVQGVPKKWWKDFICHLASLYAYYVDRLPSKILPPFFGTSCINQFSFYTTSTKVPGCSESLIS